MGFLACTLEKLNFYKKTCRVLLSDVVGQYLVSYLDLTNQVSQLTKHHNVIAYHKCHKEVAASAALLAFEPGEENCSDGLTKVLVSQAFHKFLSAVLYLVDYPSGWRSKQCKDGGL